MTSSSRKEILINALSLVPGGGSRSYVVNLLRELERDDRGFSFTLLLPSGDFSWLPSQRVRVRQARFPQRPGLVRLAWRLGYEELVLPLAARRYDLLYCIADLAPRMAGAPVVVAMRNMNIYDRRWYDNPRTRMLFRLARLGAGGAARVVFPTRAAADLISPTVGVREEQVAVVHHGVSAEAFEVDAAAEPSDVPFLLVPSAAEPHKNLEVVAEAIRHLRDPRLEVRVAGSYTYDPSHAAKVFARVECLGVGDRMRFLGPVPYEKMIAAYRGAQAVVVGSFIETFGHPLLEAMLAGTPIVASDIPAFREVADDTALYFAPDDPEGLARRVEEVTADPSATAARLERGRERVKEFTWKRSVDTLCAVFDEVLGGR